MQNPNLQTPGVYINEVNAFPDPVVPVPTALPAFIGYTPQAVYDGQSCLNQPVKIRSLADFEAIFCLPGAAQQYSPQYYLVPLTSDTVPFNDVCINGTNYLVLPDPATVYYLYNCVRHFYLNGGGDAYIVSVGGYGPASGKAQESDQPLVNPNVELNALMHGVTLMDHMDGVSLCLCPDATLLSQADNGTLTRFMLQQCGTLGSAICLFDVPGAKYPAQPTYMDAITAFRNSCGTASLDYGTVYYPFVGTTLTQSGDLDYSNLFGGNVSALAPYLTQGPAPDPNVTAIIAQMEAKSAPVAQLNSALLQASPSYSAIYQALLNDVNLLPAGGAMAGVMATVDNQSGVWTAPANVGIAGVDWLPINLSDAQQGPLNMDPVAGKSVNAIREFPQQGILVWGARTLDGNSPDYQYVNMRRTLIYIEQSCKMAAQAYVFAANDKNTWEAIKAMISSFLTSLWKEGGLLGATASDAFSVACGLGSTMTADDILNGFVNVTVKVAVLRPAGFTLISFQQQQAVSS